MLLGIAFILVGLARGENVLTSYPCPRQCNCYQGSVDEEVVSIVCRVDYIHPDDDFYVIRTQITSILYIICTEKDTLSHVKDGMFNNLESFMGLSVENCRVSYMPGNFLSGLQSLEQIEIKSAGTLEMEDSVFHQVPKLTHVTIASSHVVKMPDLCKLSNLKFLNVSDNDFQSMESTGVLCKNDTVLPHLTTLILDKNSIFNISSGSLKSLPNLNDFRIADGNLVNIEEDALSDIQKITFLDLTNNAISNVSVSQFSWNRELEVLGLGRNPLKQIHPKTFSSVKNLIVLTLDYSGLDNAVWESLYPFRQLKDLQLQGNSVTMLNRTVLRSLSSLRNLDLGDNRISDLSTEMFQAMAELQFLHVNQNNLTEIRNNTFLGLQKLVALDLRGNRIKTIEKGAFSHFVSLAELDLSNNCLSKIPSFNNATTLQSLDLSSNYIQLLSSNALKGLQNLQNLVLFNNSIKQIETGVFRFVPALQTADFSFNEIHRILKETFEGLQQLSTLFLQNNLIENISIEGHGIPSLRTLNLSSNLLSSKIASGMFPDNVENLDLSYNNISDITEYAFYSYEHLRRLSLKGNKLTTLAMNDLAVPIDQSRRTIVYISDNPFDCDCKLIWLRKKVNEISMNSGFPMVGDIYSVQCEKGYRIQEPVPFYSIPTRDMLCEYTTECTKNCFCCEFEPCDCKFVCPYGCSCYSSADFMTTHYVQCTKRGLTKIPAGFPASSTEVSLDRNNISEIYSSSFVGLIYLRVIHLDHSGITTLANNSFIGLLQLKTLYLNNNELQEINRGVFNKLWNLTELHLEYNNIAYIEEGAFSALTSLSTLFLDHNLLISLPQSATNHFFWFLSNIRLGENPWSCSCDVMAEFIPMVMNRSMIISDYSDMFCKEAGENANFSMKEVLVKRCTNITSEQVFEMKQLDNWPNILKILVITVAAIILTTFFIIIVICLWRPIVLFTHRKCKCCVRKRYPEDGDKSFDAFLAYSHKDDDYVTREFIPRLENELKYRLCVYYRDFPIGGTIADTVASSINRSKRTILLVSKHFNDHEWRNTAFQHSFGGLFKQKDNHLIIVLLDDAKGMKLDRQLKVLVKSHHVISYRDMCFWEQLQYKMGSSKRSIVRNNTPDLILNHSYTQQQDADGYETPVSSSASNTETDKCRRSLDSINNIYEEIRSSKLSDISLV